MSLLRLSLINYTLIHSPQTDITKNLEGVIFSSNAYGAFNPYDPDGNGLTGIIDDDNVIDQHGQFRPGSTFLDVLFNYVKVGEDTNTRLSGLRRPIFNPLLRALLVESYSQEIRNNDLIEYYDDCKNDGDKARAEECNKQLEILEQNQAELAMRGLSRLQLDDSIAIIFGKGTTIGQVCSYSRGLESQTVTETPGSCCLDAPYEAKDWGETVSDELNCLS